MGTIVRGHDFIANRMMIEESLRREVEANLLFANIIGDVKVETQIDSVTHAVSKRYISSGKVVDRLRDTLGLQSDHFLIPFLMSLKQDPKLGDAWLKGTGERALAKWGRSYLNQIAGVVLQKAGNMDKMRDDEVLALFREAKPLLRDWFVKQLNAFFTSAFYGGASFNITEGLLNSPNGIGLKQTYHPNMYYNQVVVSTGIGSLTAIGTEGKNKKTTEITAKVVTDYAHMYAPSTAMIDALAAKCEELGIQKAVDYNGTKLWLSVISRKTLNMLKRDEVFRDSLINAFAGKGWDAPLFSRNAYIYGEFMFVLDGRFPRRWDSTTTDFVGKNGQYIFAPTDDSGTPNEIITVLGPGAFGYAEDAKNQMNFVPSSDNFDQQIEIAGMSISGVNRMEVVNETDEPNYFSTGNANKAVLETAYDVLNQSSLILFVART